MPKHMEKRIGRTERDATLTLLRRHFEDDRITQEEFDERMAAALQAHFQSQLAKLTEDLPDLPDPEPLDPRTSTPPGDRLLNRLVQVPVWWWLAALWVWILADFAIRAITH